MANHNFELDMSDNEGFDREFIDVVNRIQALERPPTEYGALPPGHIINIRCIERLRGVNSLMSEVFMRADSYYIIGFRRPHEEIVQELSDDAFQGHAIPGSTKLTFKVSYPEDLIGRSVGYHSFYNAVKSLGNLSRRREAGSHLLTVALVVAESVRFRWIKTHYQRIFRTREAYIVRYWMHKMIHNWGTLTELVTDYLAENEAVNANELPLEPTAVDYLYMEDLDWEVFEMEDAARAAAVNTMKLILQ